MNLEAFFSHVREMSKTASLNGEKLEPNLERILEVQQYVVMILNHTHTHKEL